MKTPAIICFLLSMLAGYASATNPPLTLLTEESPPLNFVVDGKIQGQAVDVVNALVERTGTTATMQIMAWDKAYQKVLGDSNIYIAFSKDTPADVVAQWQGKLDEMKADGSFERIIRRYLPDAELGALLKKQ